MTVQLVDCAFLRVDSASVRRGADLGGGVRSLFGYRVAVVKDAGGAAHLLVSDPVAIDRTTGFSIGAVYKCPIVARDFNTTGPICRNSELPFNFANPSGDRDVYKNVTQFGASMSTLPGGQFVVCAPGYNFATEHNQTATPGLCAYWQSIGSEPRWLEKVFPYNSTDPKDRMFGNCMGGFHAELLGTPKNGGGPRLAVSGPFCMLRRLALVSLVDNSKQATIFEHASAHDYMGFSLASDRVDGSVYATSPHTDGATFMARIPLSATAQKIITGHNSPFHKQLHRSFNYIGYSSVTITVSADGTNRTAIVLGAPFESSDTSSPNRGCVFVVPVGSEGNNVVTDIPTHYCGSDAGGRLGTSVVNLGDINHDGSEDFAVGCPGCGVNRTGAVYLFLGLSSYQSAVGVSKPQLEPFEIVHAANVSSEISGLGWSLALAGDVDGNGVGELVASAITSGHVVVLPGKALLDTSIDFRNAATKEPLESLISMSQFSDTTKKDIVMTITMKAGPEINLSSYQFNLEIRLQELTEEEQSKRFEIVSVNHSSAMNAWWQLNRIHDTARNRARFELKFKLKVLSNIQRHIPVSRLLRDVNLLVQWRVVNRAVPIGTSFPFPAVLYKTQVFSTYENEFKARLFGFRNSVCSDAFCRETGNIQLTLLNASTLMLNSFQPITVALSVEKTTAEAYYGGAAIQMNMTQGVLVMGSVMIQQNSATTQHSYWSEHKEVLITEPYPSSDELDLLTSTKRGKLIAYVQLKFDGRHSNYRVNFDLVNIMAKEGYKAYVTEDEKPGDNKASMDITFNTSLLLKLLSRTEETTVVDTREGPDEAALLSLKNRVYSDKIGPGLQHTYELYAVAKPMIPVHDIKLTVRLPFVTSDNKLLLYFPRNSIGSTTRQTDNQYLPGLPFLSDDDEGSVEHVECRPVEKDLAELLFKPDLILLDTKHSANASDRVRREVSAPEQLNRGVVGTLGSSPLDNLNASASMATSEAGSLPGGKNVELVPVFDCEQPDLAPFKFRCITFSCGVRTMIQNGSSGTADKVFLHIHAKVWPPTFFAAHMKSFSVKSDIALDWLRSPAFKYVDKTDNSSAQQTFLFLKIKPKITDELPWGYIILAIFLGILLLLLFILLLWYCNFFRRKKFDYSALPQREAQAEGGGEDEFYQ